MAVPDAMRKAVARVTNSSNFTPMIRYSVNQYP
jgi:hypothetical protein